jgi:hypothetical protein
MVVFELDQVRNAWLLAPSPGCSFERESRSLMQVLNQTAGARERKQIAAAGRGKPARFRAIASPRLIATKK